MEPSDLSGQILDGRYQVIGPIGEGAMGSVYRAERLKLGRIVAVKVMNEQLPDEMASRRRFEREATAMAKLEHPHCASVLDIGVHNARPYVVMDFVSGTNLTKLIAEGPVPIARAVEITRQVLSGLAHAHELKIVHRDIKPANIVLSQKAGLGDHVKILDFGLARLNEESSNLTAGVILGTPSYMAPEQIRGLLIDGRADLYACGILLFELLTGTKPFRATTSDPLAVCMMHLHDAPPRLADKLPGHDFGVLEDVVSRALEKDRDRRFATAGEFAEAMSGATGRPASASAATSVLSADAVAPPTSVLTVEARPTSSTPASPASRPASPRRRQLAIGGAVLAVVAIVAIVVATRGGSSSSATPITSPLPIADAAVAAPPEAPRADDPVAELVARAGELAAGGRHKPAIDLLVKARKTYPGDARLPYHAGRLYLEKMYFADGLPLVRAAIGLDPAYRSDGVLIKLLVRGFNATASYDGAIARFLRNDIGEAAKPYLEETARTHPNPIVRNRATAELRRY
jgi:eukaryotic-like serine/threonine-protein kinase